MAISWPDAVTYPGFPQYFLVGSVDGGPEDVVLRTNVDQGVPRVRSRYKNANGLFSGTLLFPTRALYQVFKTFWKTTLNNGTATFTWWDPEDPTSLVTMRFEGPYKDSPQTDQIRRVQVNVRVLS